MKLFNSPLIIFLSLSTISLFGQEGTSKLTFNGYLSGMPQMAWTTTKFDTLSQSDKSHQYLLHNRLNIHWFPSDKISGTIQFRNQLMYGDFTKDAGYNSGFETESYFLPLTYYLTYSDAGLLSLSADRAWMQFTHNNLEFKIGRQRINWGQTFVWNPNDIFNAYNFFDFDYVERPGADAIRAIYYPNYTSTVEIAAKLDSAANVTAAGLYRFNTQGIDIQFIGGYYSQPASQINLTKDKDADWVTGAGITGDLKGLSLRTEATYMLPTNESANQEDLFLWSIGLDYSFANELLVSGEFFYSSYVALSIGNSIFDLYSGPLTVKNLAFAKYNGFIQASYPITPILKSTIAGMYYKDEVMNGFFLGPSLDYSILNNLDLALYFQLFKFKYEIFGGELQSQTSFAFLRLKWSF